MYINEVLRRCDMLCPNEYSDDEKYRWCDELSAMLVNEHIKKYEKVTVSPDSDGSYLLPEGVTFEMIDRIIDGKKEVDKIDFRSYGIDYLYGRDGRFTLPAKHRVNGNIDIVYLKQHEPIRNIVITGTYAFTASGVYVPSDRFKEGDSITVSIKDGITISDVPVISVHNDRDMAFIEVADGTFEGLIDEDEEQSDVTCTIKRTVTEETVCDAPYDRMYIDYVMAQVCYYQRNFSVYNQHMSLFNQRLSAYQAWLQQRRTQDNDGQFVNWW